MSLLTADDAAAGRRVQMRRADLKRAIAAGEIAAADAAPDPAVGNMLLVKFFQCIPGVGEKRADRLIEDLECEPWHRVRDLTPSDLVALREEERFLG